MSDVILDSYVVCINVSASWVIFNSKVVVS